MMMMMMWPRCEVLMAFARDITSTTEVCSPYTRVVSVAQQQVTTSGIITAAYARAAQHVPFRFIFSRDTEINVDISPNLSVTGTACCLQESLFYLCMTGSFVFVLCLFFFMFLVFFLCYGRFACALNGHDARG